MKQQRNFLVLKVSNQLLSKVTYFLSNNCSTALYKNVTADNVIIDLDEIRNELDSENVYLQTEFEAMCSELTGLITTGASKDIEEYDMIELYI